MSFIVNDPVFEYVAPPLDCPACFGAGKTPNILIFAMGDILQGNNWIPADPPPPNGIWLVPVNIACNWNTVIGPWTLDWTSAPGISTLGIQTVAHDFGFWSGLEPPCTMEFTNANINPIGNKWYGGWGHVIVPLPDTILSIQNIMALLNMDPHDKTYANLRPLDADTSIYIFSRPKDETHVRIKYNHP